jgi:hypothetical protein
MYTKDLVTNNLSGGAGINSISADAPFRNPDN